MDCLRLYMDWRYKIESQSGTIGYNRDNRVSTENLRQPWFSSIVHRLNDCRQSIVGHFPPKTVFQSRFNPNSLFNQHSSDINLSRANDSWYRILTVHFCFKWIVYRLKIYEQSMFNPLQPCTIRYSLVGPEVLCHCTGGQVWWTKVRLG